MKKLLLLVAIATFGFSNLHAQGDIQFGVKAGLNLASWNGDIDNIKSRVAFHIGGVAEIPITEKFSFQPEVLYSSQGAEEDDGLSFGGVSANDKYKLDYVNVPLMAKYYVIDNLGIELGPLVGILVSAKYDFNSGNTDVKDTFKPIDFGVAAGASYKLDFGLNFGLRYNFGLADINDVEGSDTKINNGVFQVSVGYMF